MHNLANPGRDPRSRGGRVLLVLRVGRGDGEAALADVVPGAADDPRARGGDGAERLVALGVAKGED